MSNKDRKSLRSYLKNLMLHIIKWKSQPGKRSTSWLASIRNSRNAIKKTQTNNPGITDEFIEEIWDETLQQANKKAETEMKQKSKVTELSWEEVFKSPYFLALLIGLMWWFFA